MIKMLTFMKKVLAVLISSILYYSVEVANKYTV